MAMVRAEKGIETAGAGERIKTGLVFRGQKIAGETLRQKTMVSR
jgi:hypothetical protein